MLLSVTEPAYRIRIFFLSDINSSYRDGGARNIMLECVSSNILIRKESSFNKLMGATSRYSPPFTELWKERKLKMKIKQQ